MKKVMFKVWGIVLTVCILTGLLTGVVTVFASGELIEYSLLDGNYVRLLGRGEVYEDSSRTFNWPNSGFEFSFSGTTAKVNVTVSNNDSATYNGNYFNVQIDGGEPVRIKLVSGENVICEGLTEGIEHTVKLVRSSEAANGTLRMNNLITDAVPYATEEKIRKMEFIGDSYTVGYGNRPELTENYDDMCALNTDNWYSYASITARYFDADHSVIAQSGNGVYSTYGGSTNNTMSQQFNYAEPYLGSNNMSTRTEWNFMKYQPQVVVMWLGTNDKNGASKALENGIDVEANFESAYVNMLENIRAKYPSAAIICCTRPNNTHYGDKVEAAVKTAGGAGKKFYFLEMKSFKNSGIDNHPTAQEHEAIADDLIKKIENVVGDWDLTSNEDDNEYITLKADYNTSTISVIGNTGKGNEYVSALVLAGDLNPIELEDATKAGSIKYFNQTTTDSSGEYSLVFDVEKLKGGYTLYINSQNLNDVKSRSFEWSYLLPDIAVVNASDNEAVDEISDVKSGDKLNVELTGFELDSDFKGMLTVAQYNTDNRLVKADVFNTLGGSDVYGSEVKNEITVNDGISRIVVYYWDALSYRPLVCRYDIQ